ncbi:hypothetical protein HK104_011411 [Borealophlyctis nickersoniae]|nr:hypothetical protein HK104_011411 [Borealophlyctis nickersoniae]
MAELQGEKVSEEERRRMIRMLDNFEKESRDLENEDYEGEQETEVVPDLAERLRDIDLDTASPDTILSVLTPTERKTFEAALKEGSNAIETVVGVWHPWWLVSDASSALIRDLEGVGEGQSERQMVSGSTRPPILPNIRPLETLTKAKPNTNIYFGVVDILCVYAFVSRYFNGDLLEDAIGTCQVVWDLSHTLSTNQPFAYEGIEEAVATKPTYGISHAALTLLLTDTTHLLSSQAHTLSALSHLHDVFAQASASRPPGASSTPSSSEPRIPRAMRTRAFTTSKKLYFYTSLFSEKDAAEFLSVAQAAVKRIADEEEKVGGEMKVERERVDAARRAHAGKEEQERTLIEEV